MTRTTMKLSIAFALLCSFASAQVLAPRNGGQGTATVADLAGYKHSAGHIVIITDGTSSTDCTAGSGSTTVFCRDTGAAWTALTIAGSVDLHSPGAIGDVTAAPSIRATKIYDAHSVMYYGAKCDATTSGGVITGTNDHAAFVAALAAQVHGFVTVPTPATCYVGSTLVINGSNTVVKGEGGGAQDTGNPATPSGKSVLLFDDGQDGIDLFQAQASPQSFCNGCGIEQLSILHPAGKASGASAVGIHVGANFVRIRLVNIGGFTSHGIWIDGGSDCSVVCSDNFDIEESDSSSNGGDGVHIKEGNDNSAGLLLQDSAFNNSGYGFELSDFLVGSYHSLLTTGNTLGGYHSDSGNNTRVLTNLYSELEPPSVLGPASVVLGGANLPIAGMTLQIKDPLQVPAWSSYFFRSTNDTPGLENEACGGTVDVPCEHVIRTMASGAGGVAQWYVGGGATNLVGGFDDNCYWIDFGSQEPVLVGFGVTTAPKLLICTTSATGGYTRISSSLAAAVEVNHLSNSGTGGFGVWSGGTTGYASTLALLINGGDNAQPACDSSHRMNLWTVPGTTGVKDIVQVCTKDAADVYAWRTVDAETFTDLSAHPTTLSGYGITDALGSSTVLPADTTATAHNFFTAYNSTTGAFTKAQPACADVSDAGTLCTSSATLAATKAAVAGSPLLSYDASAGTFTQGALTASQVGALASSTVLPANTTATGSNYFTAYDSTTGAFTKAQPACSDLSNGGTLCASSAALAANTTATTHQFFTAYTSSSGAFTKTQPACGDLSDGGTLCTSSAALAANTTATTHQFFTAYTSSSGAFTKAQPACGDISDSGTNCATSTAIPAPSSTTPVIDGTGAVGIGTTYARADHVHPTDTTRAPLASPTFTGTVGGITATMVDLGSVTNDAQTKAAVVPNTAPSAGQILVGNAGGTAYAPVSMGGDATMSSAGALAITQMNGANLTVNTSGVPTKVGGITTAGQGVQVVQCIISAKVETGADAALLSCTPASAVGTYEVCIALDVSAATSATLGWTMTWTNTKAHANAPTNMSLFQMGVAAPAVTFTAAASNSYYACVPISVSNAGTAIVVKTTFSGTSIAYNASATVTRII